MLKSLEIVNKGINEVENYGGACGYEIRGKDLQTIKQDLEVLDIIRKKKVDVNDVYICDRYELYIIYMKNLEISEELILTLEEFNKLKQWLKENEHDN